MPKTSLYVSSVVLALLLVAGCDQPAATPMPRPADDAPKEVIRTVKIELPAEAAADQDVNTRYEAKLRESVLEELRERDDEWKKSEADKTSEIKDRHQAEKDAEEKTQTVLVSSLPQDQRPTSPGQFTQLAGYSSSSSTLDGKVDVAGPGVQFLMTLAGADDGKIGIGDPWPTDSAAGFGWDPVLSHWTSLAGNDSYQMTIQYLIRARQQRRGYLAAHEHRVDGRQREPFQRPHQRYLLGRALAYPEPGPNGHVDTGVRWSGGLEHLR